MAKLPGVSHRRAVKAFEKAGFCVVREIIKDAGITVEEFKKML